MIRRRSRGELPPATTNESGGRRPPARRASCPRTGSTRRREPWSRGWASDRGRPARRAAFIVPNGAEKLLGGVHSEVWPRNRQRHVNRSSCHGAGRRDPILEGRCRGSRTGWRRHCSSRVPPSVNGSPETDARAATRSAALQGDPAATSRPSAIVVSADVLSASTAPAAFPRRRSPASRLLRPHRTAA